MGQWIEAETLLARLLETWAMERDIDLRGYQPVAWPSIASAQADECYRLGRSDGMPDLVIEVEPSGEHDFKLQTYASLGIREVWQWRPAAQRVMVLELHCAQYRERDGSAVLPDLDLQRLARFVRPGESHTRLVRAYRETF